MVGFVFFVSVFVFVEETGCFRQINKAVRKHMEILNFLTNFLNKDDIFFISNFKDFWFGAFVVETSYVRPINKAAMEARGNFEFLN